RRADKFCPKYYLAWTRESVVITRLSTVFDTLTQVGRQTVSLAKIPENFKYIREVFDKFTTALRCPITDRKDWDEHFLFTCALLYIKTDMLKKNIILGDNINENPNNIFQ